MLPFWFRKSLCQTADVNENLLPCFISYVIPWCGFMLVLNLPVSSYLHSSFHKRRLAASHIISHTLFFFFFLRWKKVLNHPKCIPWIPRPLPSECLFLLNIYLCRTNPKWFDDRGHASVIFQTCVKIHFKPSSPLIFHLISGALMQYNYIARAQNVNRTSSQIGDPNTLKSICLCSYSVLETIPWLPQKDTVSVNV